MGGRRRKDLGVFILSSILRTGRVVSGQRREVKTFSVYFCCHLIGMTKATLEPATVFYHLRQNWVWVHLVLYSTGKMEWIWCGNCASHLMRVSMLQWVEDAYPTLIAGSLYVCGLLNLPGHDSSSVRPTQRCEDLMWSLRKVSCSSSFYSLNSDCTDHLFAQELCDNYLRSSFLVVEALRLGFLLWFHQ